MGNETQRVESFQIKVVETVTSGKKASGVNTGWKFLGKYAGQASYRDICPDTHGLQNSQKQNKTKQKQTKNPRP